MRQLSITREKFIRERNHLLTEMKAQEEELKELAESSQGQKRLILNVYGHTKNQAATLNEGRSGGSLAEKVGEEAARNERIAKQMNRSKFMGLGENPPNLYSESEHPLLLANPQIN